MMNDLIQVHRVFTHVEEIHHEFGPPAQVPLVRDAIAAVLRNPYAGAHHVDILPMMEALNPLGVDLARQLCNAMGVSPEAIQGYGKGAIVGTNGEIEHAAALIHPRFGAPVRKVVIQVVAGRNIAVLVEAAVRNTILQLRGVDTYQEFIERHHRAQLRVGDVRRPALLHHGDGRAEVCRRIPCF